MIKWLAFAVLTMIYGTGFLFIEIAVGQLSPVELTILRLLISTSCLWAFVLVTGQPLPSNRRVLAALVVVGLFNIAVPFNLVAWAQQQAVDSGVTAVLIATNPLFSLVLAHLVFEDERMTGPKIAGVVFGFGGAIILASRNWQGGELSTIGLVAYGAVIFSAFCFAAMGTYSRKIMQGNISPLTVATLSSTIALIIMLVSFGVHVAGGGAMTSVDTLEPRTVFAVIYLGLVNTFGAFTIGYFVLRELGVTRASTTTYIVPVISLALGALFLGEIIDLTVIIGTVVILGGVAVVNIGSRMMTRRRASLHS